MSIVLVCFIAAIASIIGPAIKNDHAALKAKQEQCRKAGGADCGKIQRPQWH